MTLLTGEQAQRLAAAPVGRLATAGPTGTPHVIPVCFALDETAPGQPVYSVLDQKPKRAALTRLRRVRNILENPQAALVVDHYAADWGNLWYILITGRAELLELPAEADRPAGALAATGSAAGPEPEERARAIHLLRRKYPQYRAMDIDDNPVIKLTPRRVAAWAAADF